MIIVRPDGGIQFEYRSFCFAELGHMEACNIFELCFEYMSKEMGITKEKLIEEAQSCMTRRL